MAAFELRSEMPVPAAALARWLGRPGTEDRLSPPWLRPGTPPPPAATRVEEGPAGASILVESAEAGERLLRFRHAVARADLARHAPHAGAPPLRVALSGSSGLIGSALAAFLASGGHEVRRLPRGEFPKELLEGADAVVHLGGSGIADGRWTAERKRSIRDSRVAGTGKLVEALSGLPRRPATLLCASAIGYYGGRGAERVDEGEGPGAGFLAEVCRAWEGAALGAGAAGMRTVLLRLGVVLSARGGALAKMLPAFRAGLGGPVGGGRQGFSWIAHDDVVYAIHHLIRDRGVAGPVNVVAPHPVSQRDFARVLGRALRRPAVLPVPAVVVKAVFGEMGEEALLRGVFAVPRRLEESRFEFAFPELPRALAHTLGRS